jgi:hypothetical protein
VKSFVFHLIARLLEKNGCVPDFKPVSDIAPETGLVLLPARVASSSVSILSSGLKSERNDIGTDESISTGLFYFTY